VDHLMAVAEQQLTWQLDAYNSLETKAIGLLAFDGALGAVVMLWGPLNWDFRIAIFAGLMLSISMCARSLAVRRVYVGPRIGEFYAYTVDADDSEATVLLLAGLATSVDNNTQPLAQKGIYWTIASYAMVAAVSVFGLSLAISQGGGIPHGARAVPTASACISTAGAKAACVAWARAQRTPANH
jgi:hypothetical protein